MKIAINISALGDDLDLSLFNDLGECIQLIFYLLFLYGIWVRSKQNFKERIILYFDEVIQLCI